LFTQGKYSDAQAYFQKYLEAHPDDEFSGLAALGLAKSLEAQGKLSDAAGAFQHVIQDFPDAQAVVNAKFSLAQIYLQQQKYGDARMRPSFGRSSRSISRRNEDLPDPDGPTRKTNSPLLIVMSTFSRAARFWFG
jgi:tetratricopeptide (TPR) repeat protein